MRPDAGGGKRTPVRNEVAGEAGDGDTGRCGVQGRVVPKKSEKCNFNKFKDLQYVVLKFLYF